MGSNVFVIRDLRIECCSAFNFSSYLTATFSSSISIYFVSTSFQVPFDTIASLNFSQHGVSVNSYPPMDRSVGSGSMTAGELSQSSCPRGYGVSGLYGQVINPDTDRAYFQSLYAYCSVRCSPCPLDFYCIGNASAARCPLNSHTGPRLGAAAEASCLCSSGYTKRGSTCYCPVALMLGPDGACTQCLNNSVCSGDNIAVPCPMHSAVKFQVASTSPGVCVCVDGYFYSSSMSSCVQCQAGYYCTNNTMTLCWNNSDSLQEGAGGCDCVPGFYATAPRVCSQCPTGSFCVGGQAAEPCRQGWYADTIGSSVCTECPLNSGSPAPGASRLEQCVCAPGFTGFPGSSTCYPCPPGGYCPGYGETMVLCLSGTYQTGYGGRLGSDCSSCDPGTYDRSAALSRREPVQDVSLEPSRRRRGCPRLQHAPPAVPGRTGQQRGSPRACSVPRAQCSLCVARRPVDGAKGVSPGLIRRGRVWEPWGHASSAQWGPIRLGWG